MLDRIPMVAGLAYLERIRRLPSAITVILEAEPENRYFRHALAVLASGEKIGYVAPEIARRYYEQIVHSAAPVRCPARHARQSDHDTSGVELLLDFSSLPEPGD